MCFVAEEEQSSVQRVYANLETMHGHTQNQSANGLFAGLPSKTSDLKVMDDGQLPAAEINKQQGLLLPADNFKTPDAPCHLSEVTAGKQVTRPDAAQDKDALPSVEKLSYGDPHLEAKLFPHLFPHGSGSFFSRHQALM